jgi:hypothetical protein
MLKDEWKRSVNNIKSARLRLPYNYEANERTGSLEPEEAARQQSGF